MAQEQEILPKLKTTEWCCFIKMRVKNPNKNNSMKVLVETLKQKGVITEAELEIKKEELKNVNKRK